MTPVSRWAGHRARQRWAASRETTHRLAGLVLEDGRRRAYLERHVWRNERIAALDVELEHHWAATTLAAARQDDPLAFGDRLRSARAHYAARLDVDDGARPGAERDGEGPGREDADAVAELDPALDHTRAARVRALANAGNVSSHLAAVLGEPPAGGPGRAAWCGLALQVEAYRDRRPDRSLDGYNDVVTAIGPRPSPRWHPDERIDTRLRLCTYTPRVAPMRLRFPSDRVRHLRRRSLWRDWYRPGSRNRRRLVPGLMLYRYTRW